MKEEEEGKTKKEKKKKQEEDYPNSWLITTIYKTFKGILLESAFYKLLQDVLAFVSPQLLKWVWDERACFHPQIWLGHFELPAESSQLSQLLFGILSTAAFTIFCPHTSSVSPIGSLPQ